MGIARNEVQTLVRILANEEKVGAILTDNDGSPIDLSSITITFRMVDLEDASVIVSAGACTEHPTTTFTAATTDVITAVKHGLTDDTEVIFTTTDTLPAGLATSTKYFVRDSDDDTFKVSATKGGTAVDITDTGTGTHTFAKVGHVTYSPATADVDTAGLYAMYFVDNSSPARKWPYDGAKFRMKIIAETEEIS